MKKWIFAFALVFSQIEVRPNYALLVKAYSLYFWPITLSDWIAKRAVSRIVPAYKKCPNKNWFVNAAKKGFNQTNNLGVYVAANLIAISVINKSYDLASWGVSKTWQYSKRLCSYLRKSKPKPGDARA